MRTLALTLLLGSCGALALTPAEQVRAAVLVRSYPQQLVGVEGDRLIWKDGTRMPLARSGARDYVGRLNTAGLLDQLDARYPACSSLHVPAHNEDPGRVRHQPFFDKLYGSSEAEVKAQLERVDWFGQPLLVTRVGGAAASLRLVKAELARHPELMPYVRPSAGTFLWRSIAGSSRRSVHSYGAAIDLNTKYSAYWRWNGYREGQAGILHRNQMPAALVFIFEKHGWAWGGRWYHYDTMHFEYRPELVFC